MASITVLAGDFLQGDGDYRDGVFTLRTSLYPWPGLTLPLSRLKSVEVANEDSINNIKQAIGFGVAGAMLLGPIGAFAGFMLAGKEHTRTGAGYWLPQIAARSRKYREKWRLEPIGAVRTTPVVRLTSGSVIERRLNVFLRLDLLAHFRHQRCNAVDAVQFPQRNVGGHQVHVAGHAIADPDRQ
jgi:hypothetical protein